MREILAREGLFVGARLRWPDDPAVARARLVLLHSGEFSKVAFRLEPVAKDTQVARVIFQLEEQDFGEVAAIYGGSSR